MKLQMNMLLQGEGGGIEKPCRNVRLFYFLYLFIMKKLFLFLIVIACSQPEFVEDDLNNKSAQKADFLVFID
jgi:hypothetical protein